MSANHRTCRRGDRKLPAGLWKRSGVYYARFSHNGRQVRQRLHADRRIAEEMLAELRLKTYRFGTGTVSNDYQLDKLFDEWLRSASQTVGKATAVFYRHAARTILRLISARNVEALDTEHVEVYRAERLDEGVTAATVNHEVRILMSALKWAVNRKKIGTNPVVGLKPLKHEAKEARPLTADEVQRFLDAAHSPLWRDIWHAYLVAGLRKMELARLVFSDIDWTSRELIVRAGNAKSGKTRRLPMDDELFRIVSRQYEDRGKRQPTNHGGRFSSDHVFVTKDNTTLAPMNIYRRFLATCRRAKIDTATTGAEGNVVEFVAVHSLRHTFCTHLIMAGQSPKTVQELMGHATLDMTMKVYSRAFPENKRAAIDQLSYGAGPSESADVIRLQR